MCDKQADLSTKESKKNLDESKTNAFGDCSRCRHSIAYHLPLTGCIKCNCDEYH